MKRLFVVFIMMIIGVNTWAQEEKLHWLTNFEEAQKISKEEKKPILMYFTGSDWCSPCKMLKEDFWDSPDFAVRSNNFVLLYIDEPRRTDIITPEQREYNRSLGRKFNQKGVFPNIVAFNYRGKVIGSINGYSMLRDTERHFTFVDSILENNN
ncbi:thioredoxin family protein [Abyssalbus ytuae]|uniref:Thioredoxin family protein n=1 Tax=Abyssalbus ytuae TaxID=2926907 RepID=A0A9E6ZRZ8_9FLAO|nr:thioredoxin family protein [Abyssalbus ytuae]UOB17763.1 thioredoxin family protein [Abyssalbus ytuae]